MASLVVAGDTSGSVTLSAPSVSGSTVLTLPTTTGTLVVTGGAQTVQFAAGSAASPSITFTGDTNTGIFSPGADTIAFTEGGTEAMRLDNAGNVGIGTTSPSSKLNVQQSAAADATIRLNNTNAGAYAANVNVDAISLSGSRYNSFYSTNNGTYQWSISGGGSDATIAFGTGSSNTERMRIDSSGRVGIGTNNPSNRLVVQDADTTGTAVNIVNTSSGGYNWNIFSVGSAATLAPVGSLAFRDSTNGVTRMLINSSGSLLIGKTAAGAANQGFEFEGGGNGALLLTRNQAVPLLINRLNNDGAVIQFRLNSSDVGSVSVSGSNTAYNTSSDYRLKENIAPMVGALDVVSQLKPVTYNWKADGSSGQGFIAHELQAVVPDCVTGEKDGMRTEQYEVSPAIPATYDEDGNELTPAVEAVMGEREVPDYQGVDTSFLVATLTAAIQEQQQIITDLKARIETLEGAK